MGKSKLLQVAIDGPAAAGKSTVAKKIAHYFGYIYCDTGAMYRAITWKAIKNGVAFNDNVSLSKLISKTNIIFRSGSLEQRVYVDDVDVTNEIRKPYVTNNVSTVSAQSTVRESLTKRQRNIASNGGIVMDGRDIGSSVLNHAEVKIFLVASVKKRAERRFKDNVEKGINTSIDVLKEEIAIRDQKDLHRKISPLIQASDAIMVDTTLLSVDEVVSIIKKIIKERSK